LAVPRGARNGDITPGVRVQLIYHLLQRAEVEVVALCRKQPRPPDRRSAAAMRKRRQRKRSSGTEAGGSALHGVL
jgi:hypothetical protein